MCKNNNEKGKIQMIKKTVKYKDFNGNDTTEAMYFHLSKVEMTKLQAKYNNDIEGYVINLRKSDDHATMLNFITDIILDSYGKNDMSGKRFIKNAKIREEFECSIAYAELFEVLISDPEKMTEFTNGLAATVDHKVKIASLAKEDEAEDASVDIVS